MMLVVSRDKDDLGMLAAGNILSPLVSHASGLQAQDETHYYYYFMTPFAATVS